MFYQKLNSLIESKKDNISFLSGEKYELLIQINTLKHGNRKKEPKYSQLLKRYDAAVREFADGKTLIKYYV